VAAIQIAIYKLGAVALPLAMLFGTDALSYRLQNSGAAALITNGPGAERIAEIRNGLPELKLVLSFDGTRDGVVRFADTLERASLSCGRGRRIRARSGNDGLRVRPYRAAKRRFARASGAHCPFSRRQTAPLFPAATRRPPLDAGRLGLGRRAAECAVARLALW